MSRKEIKAKQLEIDKLEIESGFPKDVWKYCKFSSEEYDKRLKKIKTSRKQFIELLISKIHLRETSCKYVDLDGALSDHHARRLTNDSWYRQVVDYYPTYPRLAIYNNGDHVMLKDEETVE
jgi:hypothetical protein